MLLYISTLHYSTSHSFPAIQLYDYNATLKLNNQSEWKTFIMTWKMAFISMIIWQINFARVSLTFSYIILCYHRLFAVENIKNFSISRSVH